MMCRFMQDEMLGYAKVHLGVDRDVAGHYSYSVNLAAISETVVRDWNLEVKSQFTWQPQLRHEVGVNFDPFFPCQHYAFAAFRFAAAISR
jgi:hypothetical protein